ncbi:hypothetical protein [Nonomuraea sp. NPDC003754]
MAAAALAGGIEYAAPGPRPDGVWASATVVVETTWEEHDGRWWDPDGCLWHDGAWWRAETRIARAPVGTPLPAGWRALARPEMLAEAAPRGHTWSRALREWDWAQSTPMTAASASRARGGRWHAWRGLHGRRTKVGDRWPTREAALAAAVAAIEQDRAELAWVAATLPCGLPEIRIV